MRSLSLALVATAFCGLNVSLAQAQTLREALVTGTPSLDLRLRHEYVQQGNFTQEAHATTLRAAAGCTTARWQGLDVRLEAEGVIAANSALYNSTGNGIANRPVVPDPETLGLNQGWLRYTLPGGSSLTAGRQKLVFDNARHFGTVGWRQDEQTYDGLLLEASLSSSLTARLAHLGSVNSFRRFGANGVAACAVTGPCSPDLSLSGQALNLVYRHSPALQLVGYGYWLDFSLDTAARRDTRTLGLRGTGRWPLKADGLGLDYTLEAARQQAHGQSPASVNLRYQLYELGVSRKPHHLKLGYEVLGGNGQHGFQTPLASLHAFQGWADVFLATPANGVRDAYLTLGTTLKTITLQAALHDYRADAVNVDYGREWNVQATRPLMKLHGKPLLAGVKAARYEAEGFPLAAGQPYDSTKLWAWLQWVL